MNNRKYIFLLIVIVSSAFNLSTYSQERIKGGFTKGVHFSFVSFKQEGMPEGLLKTITEAYTYDSLGNITEEIIYNEKGGIDSRLSYEYDAKGNNIKFVNRDSSDKAIFSRIKNFNSFGNETESSDYDSLGNLLSSTINIYDNSGNLISNEEIEFTPRRERISYLSRFSGDTKISEDALIYDVSGKLKAKRMKKFDKKTNIYEQVETNDQGVSFNTITCDFNSTGAPTKIYIKRKDGSLKATSVLKYDEKNNAIENLRYSGDTLLDARIIWSYDDKGNEISSVYFNGKGLRVDKRERKFNAKGALIEETVYKLGDSLGNKSIWVYDSLDRKIETAAYNNDGTLANKSVFKYDTKGNLVEEIAISKSGDEKTVYQCKSNDEGIKIEEMFSDINGNKSVFKYDSFGNPIERYQYTNDVPKKTDAWEYKK